MRQELPYTVPNFDCRDITSRPQLDNFTYPFVAADLSRLRWEGKGGPLSRTYRQYFENQRPSFPCNIDKASRRTEFSMTPRSE